MPLRARWDTKVLPHTPFPFGCVPHIYVQIYMHAISFTQVKATYMYPYLCHVLLYHIKRPILGFYIRESRGRGASSSSWYREAGSGLFGEINSTEGPRAERSPRLSRSRRSRVLEPCSFNSRQDAAEAHHDGSALKSVCTAVCKAKR